MVDTFRTCSLHATMFFFSQRGCGTAPDYTYNQPKLIVYYEMLWKLFLLFCFNCKTENPQVTMRQNGTMVTVMQQCRKCKGFFWNSQSYMPHGKHPVGNILLSLAVLMGGASVSKVLLLLFSSPWTVLLLATYLLLTSAVIHFPNCHPPLGVVQSWSC